MFKPLSAVIKNYHFKRQYTGTAKKTNFSSDTFDFINLISVWPQIAGERLAQHTIPLKNSNGYLTVLTDHSAYSQQLSFMESALKTKIIKKFPALTGKIKKIAFQSNTAHFTAVLEKRDKHLKKSLSPSAPPKVKIPHKFSPAYKALYTEAYKLLEGIQDEDLKEQLISIFIQMRCS